VCFGSDTRRSGRYDTGLDRGWCDRLSGRGSWRHVSDGTVFSEQSFGGVDDVFQGDLRLHEVLVGTEVVGPLLVLALAEGGQHNHLGVLEFVGVTQDVEHFKARDAWHHYVGNNQVGLVLLGNDQRFFTVLGSHDVIAFGH
jgi:hypothetical protein